MKTFEEIQNAIVDERNNHGDYSVSGDDLKLAAAMTLLKIANAAPAEGLAMVEDAKGFVETICEEMPTWASLNIKQN